MHDTTAKVVGGSITAVELVMSGKAPHALHLGGGLHHALQSKGAGFCVYNDASAAIAHAKEMYGAKVLYIDTDVHHGDGVQWGFYADPQVCTLSIHETGKYLFPGTGAVNERGEGDAFGTNINMPVEPYTEDESWLECFGEVLTETIARFQPDVIISQHGCDAHAFDPLAHVHCSMRVYKAMPELIHSLAHQWCEGRWIALGGGGYDIWRVVPRAWSLLWLVMSEQALRSAGGAAPAEAAPGVAGRLAEQEPGPAGGYVAGPCGGLGADSKAPSDCREEPANEGTRHDVFEVEKSSEPPPFRRVLSYLFIY